MSTPEPVDEVDGARMPLIDHLAELRTRLIRSVIAVTLGFLVCLMFAADITSYLHMPYKVAWANVFGPDVPVRPFTVLAPLEQFINQMKVAFVCGLGLAFPVVISEIYRFVSPGLYRNERAAVLPYMISAPILFVGGAALVVYFVMPALMEFSLNLLRSSSPDLTEIQPSFRVSEYFNLITSLMFAFGLAFQLPLILTILARVGMVNAPMLVKFRSFAIVILAVFAAIVTPPDPISMLAMLLPLGLLYEVSIVLVRLIERKRTAEETAAEAAAE